MNTISAAELESWLSGGQPFDLIDVRTPAEFGEVHLRGAQNIPLDRLDPQQFANRGDAPLYVVCQKGGRGAKACQKLYDAGVTSAVNVEGGTAACVGAGLPVVRGKKAISLERQVRIVAGLLVVLGAGLSFVHPGWVTLSAFVGAGLVFAGVTDTCGMGMMLARMPWNQIKSQATEGATCETSSKPA